MTATPTKTDSKKAIELNPNKAEYYEQRAWCFSHLGRSEEENADIEKAKALRAE